MSDSMGLRDQFKAANAEAVSNDITNVTDWFNKGNWGNGGFLNAMVRLLYSLSEWFAYGSICAALLIKADFLSTLPVIWVLLVALIRNPHPAPEEWNYVYWYSLFVLFFRVMFETNAFCMDVDPTTSRTDLNHWKFSMQPICPSDPISLFNPEAGSSARPQCTGTRFTPPRFNVRLKKLVRLSHSHRLPTGVCAVYKLRMHLNRAASLQVE